MQWFQSRYPPVRGPPTVPVCIHRGGEGECTVSLPPLLLPLANQLHLTLVLAFRHRGGGGYTPPPVTPPLVNLACSRHAGRPHAAQKILRPPPPLFLSPPTVGAACWRHYSCRGACLGCGVLPRGTVPHHGTEVRYVGAAPRGVPCVRLRSGLAGPPPRSLGL